MSLPSVLQQIEPLDPVRHHQRIVMLSTRVDFQFDTTRALEFALFRTFAVPSISARLDRPREFAARSPTPLFRTEMRHRSYPAGYEIDRLGPPGGERWRSEGARTAAQPPLLPRGSPARPTHPSLVVIGPRRDGLKPPPGSPRVRPA